jgi:hypothetical protein
MRIGHFDLSGIDRHYDDTKHKGAENDTKSVDGGAAMHVKL